MKDKVNNPGEQAESVGNQRLRPSESTSVGISTFISTASFWWPDYLEFSAWLDHAPFAFWLMEVHRPHTMVELGTYNGYSYFAFCQAVKALHLGTRCYAVDTWKGDEHGGFYGEDVFRRVSSYNDRQYASFSRLVRSTFDEALGHFADASIDLLHIDGRHYYEDVRHDFESWRGKLSDRAIVIFHDINVRERNFGVFKLWAELREEYPTFEFLHGHGLGILGYGASLKSQKLNALFRVAASDEYLAVEVQAAYARLGAALKDHCDQRQVQAQLEAALHQVREQADEKVSEAEARTSALSAKLKVAADEAQLTASYNAKVAAAREHEIQRLRADIRNRDASARFVRQMTERRFQADREFWEQQRREERNRTDLREKEILQLRLQLQQRSFEVQMLHQSTSWRLTRPIRAPKRIWQIAIEKIKFLRARSGKVSQVAAGTNHRHGLFGRIWRHPARAGEVTVPDEKASKLRNESADSKLSSEESLAAKAVSTALAPQKKNLRLEDGLIVLATKHTLYVAFLIKQTLNQLGFHKVEVTDREPECFEDKLYIVVCPQMFERMPDSYISFQMEQSVSERWFDSAYIERLEKSVAIMDYSLTNIQYLQASGLSYRQLYWTPLSNVDGLRDIYGRDKAGDAPLSCNYEYDVVFYGDVNNPRRKEFLSKIAERFRTLVVSEKFGEDLYSELVKARTAVNIHYYENALLETTRIFECLSLGLNVVSEESSDMREHERLRPYVAFVPEGDVPGLLDAISRSLNSPVEEVVRLEKDLNNFRFYFGRMLVALDLMPVQRLNDCLPISTSSLANCIALSLPETYNRFERFAEEHPDVPIFHGMRHQQGWIGCALSYKCLCQYAKRNQLEFIEVCEDDVLFSYDHDAQREKVRRFLFDETGPSRWDVFCGLIADIADDATVIDVIEYGGTKFVFLDKMTSMVHNIYGPKAISLIAEWDISNRDVETNTIDRYLERSADLKVVTTLPFMVGHRPELVSTLWDAQNDVYDSMVGKSQVVLQRKVDEFFRKQEIQSDLTSAK